MRRACMQQRLLDSLPGLACLHGLPVPIDLHPLPLHPYATLQVAADTFLVRFLGMDQRRLMRKRLPRGQTAAPAAQAGAQAVPAAAAQPLPQKLRMDL